MTILVTGGAGFIASHIVDSYINLGYKVIVVDDLSRGRREFVNKKAQFLKVDITDKREITNIIQQKRPDIINHHAAQISVQSSIGNPVYDAQINIIGLLNILEAVKDIKLKKIIFASSGGAIYGEANEVPTHENYIPLQPLSPYGISKLASEYYLHYYWHTHKVPYIALRYSNVYGPRQDPNGEAGVVAIFCKRMLNGLIPIINGSGRQTRDYIYVGDITDANIKAIETMFVGSVNIATGIETDVVELFRQLKSIMDTKFDCLFGSAKSGEQQRSCLNIHIAQKSIGWHPKVKLNEGLKKTVSYFKNHEKTN